MKYTVIWSEAALDQLAQLWMVANDPGAVNAASNRIDSLLERDPESAGEERPPTRRILFEPPIGVVYQFDAIARQVDVVSVGWSGRPG